MSTFDDFMIGEAVEKNQQIARLLDERNALLGAAKFALSVFRSHFQFDSSDFDEVRETLQEAITAAQAASK